MQECYDFLSFAPTRLYVKCDHERGGSPTTLAKENSRLSVRWLISFGLPAAAAAADDTLFP